MGKRFHELTERAQHEFYKAWIRGRPCCWCNGTRRIGSYRIEASHHNYSTVGPSGTGLKASDYRTVPLCSVCHTRYHKTGAVFMGTGSLSKDVDSTRNFLQRVTIDCLVEFMETMLNPEVF